MGIADWNWRLETDLQDYPWDCAACSLAWCLRAVGYPYSEQDVINGLGPGRISPQEGLLDASGAGIADWLSEIGVTAGHNPDASWAEVLGAAGPQPMLIGGRNWCHWVAVRMGPAALGKSPEYPYLWLMNPSPGWMGVDQYLGQDHFDYLGAFSAVWFEAW